MSWLNVSKGIHSSLKKHIFSFQTWSVCRDCVVSGITERLRATEGNPAFTIPEREVSKGGSGGRGVGNVTLVQLSRALVVKVLTMCACRDNFMRYFYFLHFIYI